MLTQVKEKTLFSLISLLLLCTSLPSCINLAGDGSPKTASKKNFKQTDCPAEIAERALEFAKLYEETETEYEYGGQDPLRAVKVDCSGLVIMCYKYALVDTKYSLLESDMASAYMYQNASTPTDSPRKGDLIFMGDEDDSAPVSHIAIFEKFEGDEVYFIDSTHQDTNGDGIYDINGVTERHYSRNNKKIKAYGIMRLKYSE